MGMLPVNVYADTNGDAIEITKTSIEDASINVDTIKYTGEELEPTVNVMLDHHTLVMNQDYILTYLNNIEIGTGSVTVTGIGDYEGIISKEFEILPGDIVLTIKSSSSKKIRCSWNTVEGVSGYQIAYQKTKGKTKYLTTTSTSKNITKISKNKTYTIRVRAYYEVDGKKVYGDYSTAKTVKTLTSAMKKSVYKYSPVSFKRKGIIHYKGWKWTYYSQKELSGKGLKILGRHIDSNGYICDQDGYIVLASSSLHKGTEVATPLGKAGKVYDTGCARNTLDVYVNW